MVTISLKYKKPLIQAVHFCLVLFLVTFENSSLAKERLSSSQIEFEIARALDKTDSTPVSPEVAYELKCRYLILDLAARTVGVDDDDAHLTVMIQEALKNKVFSGSFAALIEFWLSYKSPEAVVSFCPNYKPVVDLIVKNPEMY